MYDEIMYMHIYIYKTPEHIDSSVVKALGVGGGVRVQGGKVQWGKRGTFVFQQ